MTDQFISSKLLRSGTFGVGPYLIPKVIISSRDNDLSLKSIRNKYLLEALGNPNVEVFKEFMKSEFPEAEYILELPIPMKDFFLNYRCLDIFFPYLGVAVELDSHFHDDSENNDIRSDQYMYQTYGIQVIRVRLASKETVEKDLKSLRKILKITKPLSSPWPLDFSDILARDFRRRHPEEIKEIEALEKQYSGGLYNGNLVLSRDQEKILKPILKTLELSYTIWG